MPQSLLEMTKELVTEHIRMGQVSTDEAQSLLLSTHQTLLNLQQVETSGAAPMSPEPSSAVTPADWRSTITRHAIICLECGGSFKNLSARHLRTHDLDTRSYRLKYGIPKTQPLSSRAATARRRQLAKQIRPWERAHEQRVANAKRGKPAKPGNRGGAGR